MPLVLWPITPESIYRNNNLGVDNDVLEAQRMHSLCQIMSQLATITVNVEDIISGLNRELEEIVNRTSELTNRVKELKNISRNSRQKSNFQNKPVVWELNIAIGAPTVHRNTIPEPIEKLYQNCVDMPNFDYLEKFNTSGVVISNKYSNPGFFMEQWLTDLNKDMKIRSERRMKKKERKRQTVRMQQAQAPGPSIERGISKKASVKVQIDVQASTKEAKRGLPKVDSVDKPLTFESIQSDYAGLNATIPVYASESDIGDTVASPTPTIVVKEPPGPISPPPKILAYARPPQKPAIPPPKFAKAPPSPPLPSIPVIEKAGPPPPTTGKAGPPPPPPTAGKSEPPPPTAGKAEPPPPIAGKAGPPPPPPTAGKAGPPPPPPTAGKEGPPPPPPTAGKAGPPPPPPTAGKAGPPPPPPTAGKAGPPPPPPSAGKAGPPPPTLQAPESPEPHIASVSGGMDLLSAIRAGKELKRVEAVPDKKAENLYSGNDIANILARRIQLAGDSDSDDDDDEDDDFEGDDEWD